MNFRQRRPQGFTIVELLIVIVVIGILAAITIVAYNGIQTRAENSKTVNGVASYIKILKTYAADKGNYPSSNSAFACFGETGSQCSIAPGSTACFGLATVYGRDDFNNAILTQVNRLPALSSQSMACTAGSTVSGGFYYSYGGSAAYVYYFLRGSVDCGSPAGLVANRAQSQDTTYCSGTIN